MHPRFNAELARLFASDRIAEASRRRCQDPARRRACSVRRRLSLIVGAARARA
jgi:hypothetical protein